MERDRSDWSRSIGHQEIFEPRPGNFGGMDRAQQIWTENLSHVTTGNDVLINENPFIS